MDRVRIAWYDLHSDLCALVITCKRLSQADRVKVRQVSVDQDEVLLGEDKHRLVQVLEDDMFPADAHNLVFDEQILSCGLTWRRACGSVSTGSSWLFLILLRLYCLLYR